MSTCNLRNHSSWSQRLLDNAGFVISREPAPSDRPRNDLQAANRFRRRLKHMVKRRHKPISYSEIVTLGDYQCPGKVRSEHRLPSADIWHCSKFGEDSAPCERNQAAWKRGHDPTNITRDERDQCVAASASGILMPISRHRERSYVRSLQRHHFSFSHRTASLES